MSKILWRPAADNPMARFRAAFAAKTGATVVDVAQFPGGVKGTDGGYIALMDYLVNSVASALAK